MTPLEESIAHWEANYAAESPEDVHTTAEHCPLCKVHLKYKADGRCVGCPVREHTKLSGCAGTPWGVADDALDGWRGSGSSADKKDWRMACSAELDFLRSLQ